MQQTGKGFNEGNQVKKKRVETHAFSALNTFPQIPI